MNRLRATLGVVAGVLMLLSSAAHSLLGWPALRAELDKTNAPAELVQGLAAIWFFSGAAMLAFGCIVLWLFVRALRGAAGALMPARIITALYLAFGAGALVITGDPFFMVFIVPGLLLAVASFSRAASGDVPS